MRQSLPINYLFILCLFVAVSCTPSATRKSNSGSTAVVTEKVSTVAVELTIQGMSCTGCEQTIQTAVGSIKGITKVKAAFKEGKAFVEYLPEVADTAQMKEKITASGYVVTNIKPIQLVSIPL